jgi:protein-tyrosine phosphatase
VERVLWGDSVDIACDGGTGRTGVALARLAILAGVEPDEAVEWVRSHYNEYAVEGRGQEALVERFGSHRAVESVPRRVTASPELHA